MTWELGINWVHAGGVYRVNSFKVLRVCTKLNELNLIVQTYSAVYVRKVD